MELYDTIGNDYNRTRKADIRITDRIVDLFEHRENAVIADVGAGTGNYSYELAARGYSVFAIEPSATMVAQGKTHPNVTWIKGIAEKIPLKNESVDVVVCTLAAHHFTSIEAFLGESKRILKNNGDLIIFTFDPSLLPNNDWIKEYFTEFHTRAITSVPGQNNMSKMIQVKFNSIPFQK